jgi:molybdopterin-guanine dinucleotide biosynthesis protein A
MKNCYGLILCGGNSTRMGTPKALLTYHEKPQCYHLHDMVQNLCDQTFLSCNTYQSGMLDNRFPTLPDLPALGSIGPMGGLLTAFHHFPGKDFLVVGCDYPLLNKKELQNFLMSIDSTSNKNMAAAFYNRQEELYEPLLAWYSRRANVLITNMFNSHQYSLQQFLKAVNAYQYVPSHPSEMISVDTPEAMEKAIEEIRKSETLNV